MIWTRFAVLTLLDTIEKAGLDTMCTGVALAWATEALEKGVVTEKETLVPLKFGDLARYREAVQHLALGTSDFYRLLAQGTMKTADGEHPQTHQRRDDVEEQGG